jgi:DNA processing protein
MDERLLRLALTGVPALPRQHAWTLLRHYGSAAALFGRSAAELRARCAPAAARALSRGLDLGSARAALDRARELGLELLVPGADDPLASIPDPPLVLWSRGRLPRGPLLAIVGARLATPRGREMARRLALAAAEAGVAVVSGLAYGIDAAAHRGALETRGASVAVLASGLDRPSPTGNVGLARELLDAGGAWLSEYAPGTPAAAFRFPERNRLISGLCRAVLVVEAGERSGSLWTVKHALDQGRDVLAVPGPVDTASCRGSNRLIRDGAGVILEARDLLEQLSVVPAPEGASEGAEAKLQAHPPTTAHRILHSLTDSPKTPDALAHDLDLLSSDLAPALLDLELSGRIRRDGPLLLTTGR